jgi:hypothetical protein
VELIGDTRPEVGGAQQAARVHADEERQVGLPLHELEVGEALLEDDLRHGVGERGVGADPDRDVVVGVHRGGTEVGRDRHDLAAVVARLLDEVVPGDVGIDRVGVPDEHQLRVEEVVGPGRGVELAERGVDPGAEVVDLRLQVGHLEAELSGEVAPQDLLRAALARRADVVERARSLLLDGVEDGVGDVVAGGLPRHALPLPLAARAHAPHRVEDPLLVVMLLAPGGTLLAAHRVHVGYARLDGPEDRGLLLADDLPVLRIDPPRAAAGIAVDGVAAPGDLVPLPELPVLVLGGPGARARVRRSHGNAPLRARAPHQLMVAGSRSKGPRSSFHW